MVGKLVGMGVVVLLLVDVEVLVGVLHVLSAVVS